MKKIILLSFLALTTTAICAQKKAKLKQLEPSTMLVTQNDSLSYALGQTVTAGLKGHLISTGVLKDSTAADFDAKANSADLSLFLDGLTNALSTTDNKTKKYNEGMAIGNQFILVSNNFSKEMLNGKEVNREVFTQSILTALKEEKPAIENPQDYFQNALTLLQQEKGRKETEELQVLHSDRISEGAKFLEENKKQPDVVTLSSGLQYKVIRNGSGEKPDAQDRVTVHYEGRMLDGTIFDSSYKRGDPTTLGLTQVIAGWTEVLQLMPEGSKWTVYIPYILAYGSQGTGNISPYSTLVFDIELIEVIK